MTSDPWQPSPGWGQPGQGAPSAPASKPLYRKKRVILPGALLGLFVVAGVTGNKTPEPARQPAVTTFVDAGAPQKAADKAAAARQATSGQQAAEQQAAATRAASAQAAAGQAAAQQAAAAQEATAKAAAAQEAAQLAADQAAHAATVAQAEQQAAAQAAAARAATQETTTVPTAPLGDGTYTNSDGNQVPKPMKAPSAPSGATAQCNDGSWSFSQHHSGTCSGHYGVARWL